MSSKRDGTGFDAMSVSFKGLTLLLALVCLGASHPPAEPSHNLPIWLSLKPGQTAYYGNGYGPVSSCPSFDAYVKWTKADKKSGICPMVGGGQVVSVIDWKNYEFGRDFVEPIIHVRFRDSGKSAWTAWLTPIVPAGVAVVVGGRPCSNEISVSGEQSLTANEVLSGCRASVLRQQVERTYFALVVRFLRTGHIVKVPIALAGYPNIVLPNGVPQYSVARLVLSRD